ncbi:LLM class flavin-dependent oxidoreductase [Pseudonocardia lacus]|uniref:LLM class flavin-dependent oxidoreductase n=1 Tax=Pseudonocardia lacus TaxID=2835865 RepID=UPI001BDC1304|nr:LLM class flavin-dependent oxidoreductase [Pseudonocardia lacus]
MSHPFRFGVIAAPMGSSEQWLGTARRVADLGYSTLLGPDGVGMHAPFVALTAAATAVPDLRVGTFVLAGPLRPPREAAWQGHSLSVLSGGRFDFGIGTGRPQARPDAEAFGRPWGTGAERLAGVRDAIAALREMDGDAVRTPVMIAAGGPKALDVAATDADIVALAGHPAARPEDVTAMADRVRERAGARADAIELAMNLFLVGDEAQPWMRQVMGVDPAELHRIGSPGAVRGTPREMADQLLRRRDTIGTTYFAVDRTFVDALAPVVDLLAGRE